jgi:hypothetical protein
LTSTGCQVEYAGMTLPSGRYMHDDVQYFPSGPDFPWANTQAATQRARMRAMGIEPQPIGTAPVPPGYPDTTQFGGRGPTSNVNVQPMPSAPGQVLPAQPPPPNQVPPPVAQPPAAGEVPAPGNNPPGANPPAANPPGDN